MINLPSNYTRGGFIEEETEEEHAVRLARISEEVKADMKAGRYRHGQLRENVFANQVSTMGGRGSSKLRMHHEMYGGSLSGRYTRGPDYIIDSLPDAPDIQELMRKQIARMMMEPSYPERSLIRDTFGGKTLDYVLMDEVSHVKGTSLYKHLLESDSRDEADDRDGPRKPYWTQPIPDPTQEKPASTPSEAVRAKRRAKRKKKKQR